MGHHFFQQRGPADAEATDFAATVASLPPGMGADVPDAAPSAASEAASDGAVEHRPTVAHIGRYALKDTLGMGGLGQVHEAWDPLLSRSVAVKTLHFEVAASQRVALDGLFLNEARAAAGLSHPNIVTIHDAGLSPQGVYIAMERLHGRDLRRALADGWLPTPEQAAQLVRRVAEALAYAHARGVVHCDIKPANIFLCRRDKPKVLDFGIARVARSAASHDPMAMLDGLVAGSPHYLAPEQLRGEAVDARTDIHALGVVFYELLAGRKAFNGDSVEQISTAVLSNHPAPAHELRPDVPLTLSLIAAKAMAQEPAERYASAMALAAELRRWADRQGLADAEVGDRPAPAATHSRRRVALIAGGVVLATGGAALAGALAAAVGLRHRQEVVAAPLVPAAAPAAAAAPMAAVPPPPELPAVAAAVPAPAPAPSPTTPAQPPRPQPAQARKAVSSQPAAATPRPTPRSAAPVAAPVGSGTLQLAISPWGEVEINGRAAGTTPPLTRLSLPEGTHVVTVRNEDFPPYTTTVQVQADRVATVRHRF